MTERSRPSSAVVIGAGIVGLSTAWFLQEYGIDVTVVDQDGPGEGASSGNAGWVTPALASPLPSPSMLRFGALHGLSRTSPLHLVPRNNRSLPAFLASFVRNSTPQRWRQNTQALAGLNSGAVDAFDLLARAGVGATAQPAVPFLAAFDTAAKALQFVTEIELLSNARFGSDAAQLKFVDGALARRLVPGLSPRAVAAVQIQRQRYLDPAAFCAALAESIAHRGGEVVSRAEVSSVAIRSGGVTAAGHRADVAVIATGAELRRLAGPWGVRTPMTAGRGYSFLIPAVDGITAPLYLPEQRVACTPLPEGLRIAGTMELAPHNSPANQRRSELIIDALKDWIPEAGWARRTHEWVGSRPLTSDGLPMIGTTKAPEIFVAGGHGMWGVTHGPVTGRLLAKHIAEGSDVPALRPFDPCR